MIELLALLLGLAVTGGFVLLALALVVVPLFLALKIVGFGLRLVVGSVALVLGGILFLPLMVIVGGLLLLKLMILATPLLLLGGAIWLLVYLTRRPAAPAAAQ